MELRDFGDAATFLRKTNLEQLAAQSHAFDGTVIHPVCVLCENRYFIGAQSKYLSNSFEIMSNSEWMG